MKKIPVLVGVIIIAILISYFIYFVSPGEYDNFAKCLTEKGISMYGTNWCSFCQKQKNLFGKSFKYIDFVDCDKNKQKCLSSGVQSYPTWIINGENYPGLQSLDKLAQLSGCELKR